jgi:transposase
MVPVEDVDHHIECIPEACENCGKSFKGARDPNPRRWQFSEIPKVKPITTQVSVHAVDCPCCGAVSHGKVPVGTPTGAFGPRLDALIALLSGAYRLSHRCIEEMLGDCFGVDISLGSVSARERVVSDALAAPVAEARDFVRQTPARHADETGWRECGKRAWLWLAATPLVAVFLIRSSRGGDVARELLGKLGSWCLISDRWSGYNWVPKRLRQLCWAHLCRDFRKLYDLEGAAHAIGKQLLEQTKLLFKLWGRVRDGTLKRSSFRTLIKPIRREIHRLLAEGAQLPQSRLAGMCTEILKLERAMWTFSRVDGVEPTNNLAERLVRHAVMWRKTSYGTQSREGSIFVERILTAVTCCRLQRRNVLEYLTDACTSALHRRPTPSLLPCAA